MTLELPALRPLGPARLSVEPHTAHPAYATLLADAATTGSCPVWVSERGLQMLEPPRDPHAVLAEVASRDAATFLDERWPSDCPQCGCRDSFGSFTGLAPALVPEDDPVAVAAESEIASRRSHLALVPGIRPADAVAVLRWRGTCNRHDDVAGLSAVLRSWEERFGALLVQIDFMTLWLTVAAPPRTPQECRAVAAEHFAFCPDVDGEDPRALRDYAATLAGRRWWRFWWD
ncbi:DUF4253 domain-containing protein [Pseudonocardia broussonetiae]|nr:DUF4253 domain-containing protein [Pseudonocardia broussonetiae]